MLDISWQDHRVKILISLALILGIFSYILFTMLSTDEEDIKINTNIKVVKPKEKIKEKIIIKKDIKVKKIVVKKIPISLDKEIIKEVKNKMINIYQSTDNTGRYTIKLISKKTIIQEEMKSTRYVMMSRQIDNNNEINDFPLSLNEKYIDYVSDMHIEINDIAVDNNKTLKCDAYFLSGLDINSMYKIKIDIVNGDLTCYILSSEPLPDFLKDLGNKMKALSIKTQETGNNIEALDNKIQEDTNINY